MIRTEFLLFPLFCCVMALMIFGYPLQFLTLFEIPVFFYLLLLVPFLVIDPKENSIKKVDLTTFIILINLVLMLFLHYEDFYKIISFRDASQNICMFFYILGFYFFSSNNIKFLKNNHFNSLVSKLIIICFLSYLIHFFFNELSININSKNINLFFITTIFSSLIIFLFIKIIKNFINENYLTKFLVPFYFFLIFCLIFLLQSRGIYIVVILLLLILFFLYFKVIYYLPHLFTLFLVSIFLLSYFNFSGRLDINLSLTNLYNHFLTIFGVYNSDFKGSLGGLTQRYEWWIENFRLSSMSLEYILIGRGYGFPLTDDLALARVPIREVHNSFLSVYFRFGLFGIFLLLIIFWRLFFTWKRAIFLIRKKSEFSLFYFLFVAYTVVVIISSIAQDAFEKIYYAIPFYFIFGITSRLINNEYPDYS